jgi:RNA polymerase sigma-70 factor (ECF subfamily)
MDARAAAESVFREEHGRIVATLIRISGSFDRAEEAMQEAFASALASWADRGIPQNTAAWITAAAHRKLIDQSRRERTRRDKQDSLRYEIEALQPTAEVSETDSESMHFPDDRLRLIFTCCHPALAQEAQVSASRRFRLCCTSSSTRATPLLPAISSYGGISAPRPSGSGECCANWRAATPRTSGCWR